MAIKVKGITLCEWWTVDAQGRSSFISSFVNVGLQTVPGAILSLVVAVELDGDEGETFSIAITDPKRKVIIESGGSTIGVADNIVSQHQLSTTMTVLRFGMLQFKMEGLHSVIVKSGNRVIARRQFGVYLLPQGRNAANV